MSRGLLDVDFAVIPHDELRHSVLRVLSSDSVICSGVPTTRHPPGLATAMRSPARPGRWPAPRRRGHGQPGHSGRQGHRTCAGTPAGTPRCARCRRTLRRSALYGAARRRRSAPATATHRPGLARASSTGNTCRRRWCAAAVAGHDDMAPFIEAVQPLPGRWKVDPVARCSLCCQPAPGPARPARRTPGPTTPPCPPPQRDGGRRCPAPRPESEPGWSRRRQRRQQCPGLSTGPSAGTPGGANGMKWSLM